MCLHNCFPIMEVSFWKALLYHSSFSCFLNLHCIGQGSINLFVMGLDTHMHKFVINCGNKLKIQGLWAKPEAEAALSSVPSLVLQISIFPFHAIHISHVNLYEQLKIDEYDLQSVCIFHPNLVEEKRKSEAHWWETFFIHRTFYLIPGDIIQDKLFYSYSDKVRNHKWCGRKWIRPGRCERGKDKVDTLKFHSISNLHCCTRKRHGALTALHWSLNFYA